MKNRAGEKVRDIIRDEFDSRLEMAVVTYIIDNGYDNLREMTEEEILKVKGNALMTDEFCQALVRAAVRICKECNHIDEFLPFIVNYLYVPKAKMHEVEIWQDQMSKWRWNDFINELDIDFEEDADEIQAVFLNATVIATIGGEE
jgi:hypothetical protein